VSSPLIDIDDLQFGRDLKHGDRFEAKLAPVAPRIGARKLGYNVTVVAPGKRAFPFHNHHANEEMFFVLDGEGVLRFGAQEFTVRKGHFIACPAGGPQVAHQLVNTGSTELRYIAVSTTIDTDVWQYPDSGKFGCIGGRQPGRPLAQATFAAKFVPETADVDYYHGE
jgi:uncharacterized cupin superfamily protein